MSNNNPNSNVDVLRVLAMDAVERAQSGHPGMPMGMADIAEALWCEHLKHNPTNPTWPDRDRFVLSNGHGSMLLYGCLHLSGYDLSIEDLKDFRVFGSKTPGHPEAHMTPGVETTTGPLGQGLANAVGMALAEKKLAAEFNKDDFSIVDHHTYCFVGDGCLMEGISHEVCSLAGTLKLGKLVVFYDSNNISIDGEVDGWFSDNTAERFKAYNWQVIDEVNGHDRGAILSAIEQAKANTDQPTLIICNTHIGFGSPSKADTASVHGEPLGAKEIEATRFALQWGHKPFEIPQSVYEHWDAKQQGADKEKAWRQTLDAYQAKYPELAAEFNRRMQGKSASIDFDALLKQQQSASVDLATRKHSKAVLDDIAPHLPELLGGSADLSGSNGTLHKHVQALGAENPAGNYLHYGVREFGMTAIASGLQLHGGIKTYVGTFLVFSDYARNAVRMAALMGLPITLIYTHDSIGLGEDGPTHQPVEHLASLRAIPNLHVWRPCDGPETVVAWQQALHSRDTPHALALTRQTLPAQARDATTLDHIKRGGYVLSDAKNPQLVLIATGSEVALAVQVCDALKAQGVGVRVVSMPCVEQFLLQSREYQRDVLVPGCKRMAIEAGVSDSWYRFVGRNGLVCGLDRFGESAPAKVLFNELGFNVDALTQAASDLIKRT